MNIGNVWNQIIEWFRDRSERNRTIREFNDAARNAFIIGLAPTMLKASISKGKSEYRHEFSAWLYSGFRIQALSGRPLTKDEMNIIGQVILCDKMLLRRLVALGWDTLEVHDDKGAYGLRWKMIDYINLGGLLDER